MRGVDYFDYTDVGNGESPEFDLAQIDREQSYAALAEAQSWVMQESTGTERELRAQRANLGIEEMPIAPRSYAIQTVEVQEEITGMLDTMFDRFDKRFATDQKNPRILAVGDELVDKTGRMRVATLGLAPNTNRIISISRDWLQPSLGPDGGESILAPMSAPISFAARRGARASQAVA